jgi:transcription initiation factor IIE alpha subunit
MVNKMLKPLLGSESAEYVLIFIVARDEGYATEIARFFQTELFSIQKQLQKLEYNGILASRTVGRTRQYSFNPRYPFLNELKALLEKALTFYPNDLREQLLMNRRRPRRQGKPI